MIGLEPSARHVGLGIGIVLIPLHAGGHGDELAHGDALIGAAIELGDIGGDRVFQALDVAVLDGRAHQGGGDRLGDGEGGPAFAGLAAEAIALEHDLAVLQHHDPGGAHGGHVARHGLRLARPGPFGIDGDAQGQVAHACAALHHMGGRDLLHVAITVGLLLWRPGQEGAAGRWRRGIGGQSGTGGQGRDQGRSGKRKARGHDDSSPGRILSRLREGWRV